MPSSDNGIKMRTIVDLPEAERAQLDALCRQRGLSRAEALRQALRQWLDRQKPSHGEVRLRQHHGLKIPDAIILATARCADLSLATRNSRDFPLTLGGVVHPYGL